MLYRLTSLLLIVVAFIGCSTNPITGRNQFKLVSEQELQTMANQEYRNFLASNRAVSPSADRDAEMVRRVGQRLANAVTQYYRSQNLGDVLLGYNW